VLRCLDCVKQVCEHGRNWLYDTTVSYIPGYATDRCSKKVDGPMMLKNIMHEGWINVLRHDRLRNVVFCCNDVLSMWYQVMWCMVVKRRMVCDIV